MIWLIQDFDLLSVLLRALTLSLEALTVGGVLFLLLIAGPARASAEAHVAVGGMCRWMALSLAVVQLATAAENCVMLMGGSGLSLLDVVTADFFFADLAIAGGALLLFFLLRIFPASPAMIAFPFALTIVAGSVALSHAVARLDHRLLLILLTAVHHVGTAAWIGAMPFLLVAMRRCPDARMAHVLVRRFSTMALVSVAALVLAGCGMAYFYVRTWQGFYGTSYGLMLLAKIYLLLMMLALGAGNCFLLRGTQREAAPVLRRLRRFSEIEIGLGFTVLLVAASLTSQPPAADLGHDMLTRHEIAERLAWRWPSLTTPSFAQLSQRRSLEESLESTTFTGGSVNDAMDQMWSEYNHHWAGLVVLCAGICAGFARFGGRHNWFRNWPLLFLGLAVFIVLRADADAWPLGPRSFWGSFAEAEVLEHRVFAVLITAFALFEWAVETGHLRSARAALVFPTLCALGGALLMTHSHAMGAVKEETLAEMSHTSIALLGVTAGWSRWLQLRLPQGGKCKLASWLQWLWPVCLALVGVVLLNYRES